MHVNIKYADLEDMTQVSIHSMNLKEKRYAIWRSDVSNLHIFGSGDILNLMSKVIELQL